MFCVFGVPEDKKIDPVFWYLLTNYPELLEGISLKSGYQKLEKIIPGIEQIVETPISRIEQILNQKMQVVAVEEEVKPPENRLFLLIYEKLDLGYNKKGEPKTPENLSGVLPDLVLRGIKKVWTSPSIREEEKGKRIEYYFGNIPLRLSSFVEWYVERSLNGEFTDYRFRIIDANVKGIREKRLKEYPENEVVVCTIEGILHSFDCKLYDPKISFLFDLDKESMDEIIAGRFVLVPGLYIGLEQNNLYIKQPKPLKIEICKNCANDYLKKFGYELIK